MSDRMRVLLVDDDPQRFLRGPDVGLMRVHGFADHFEISWIQNPKEAKLVLTGSQRLAMVAPGELGALGLPAEVLIFDYALTGDGNYRRNGADASNVPDRVRRRLIELGDSALVEGIESDRVPSTGADRNSDRMGCYIGGALARAFSPYPCGGVPTTAKVNVANTDAAFYEWLNEDFFDGLFADKDRPTPDLEKLISIGVRSFRARLAEAVRLDLARVSADRLLEIREDPMGCVDGEFGFWSAFGERRFSVKALFADFLLPHHQEVDRFAHEASQWADSILESILVGGTAPRFVEAKRIANQYFDLSQGLESSRRYELSDLVAQYHRGLPGGPSLAPAEDPTDRIAKLGSERLVRLAEHYNLDPSDLNDPRRVKVESGIESLLIATKDRQVARWAVLLLIVLADQHHRLANQMGRKLLRIALDNDFVREAPRTAVLTELFTKEEIEHLLRGQINDSSEFFEFPVARGATVDDVYQMLDPIPNELLTFFHKRELAKDAGKLRHRLGDLRLNLAAILEGPAPFGLEAGEGRLLRAFASDVGYDATLWPAWLRESR